jgi:hypothetical protein
VAPKLAPTEWIVHVISGSAKSAFVVQSLIVWEGTTSSWPFHRTLLDLRVDASPERGAAHLVGRFPWSIGLAGIPPGRLGTPVPTFPEVNERPWGGEWFEAICTNAGDHRSAGMTATVG